jgi:cytokinesis protein
MFYFFSSIPILIDVFGGAEILIQTVKKLEPEEIAMKIKNFDQEVCTELFLSELKPVLPNPEQVSLMQSVSKRTVLTL